MTLADSRTEGERIISSTLRPRPGEYQAGRRGPVYELADGTNASSAEETLSRTVGK